MILASTHFSVNIGISATFGIVCAVLANSRGRSPVGWFFLGLFLSCIALVILLVIPDLKVEESKQRRHHDEVRKLKEQIKKERQVADERHDANRARLEAHDRALGLDTSSAEQQRLAPGSAPPVLPAAAPAPDLTGTTWYYGHDGRQQGPVPVAELRALWRSEQIDPEALVWRTGMADWTPITEVPGLLEES